MARIQYLFKVLKKYLIKVEKQCPFCKGQEFGLIGRKYFLLQLLKCNACGLMFRYPTEEISESIKFYQDEYKEGMTTRLPDEFKFQEYLNTCFLNTEKDFSEKIRIVRLFKSNGKLLDFGCSWGYGTLQLQKSGFDVTGFEISKERVNFGKIKLGLTILDDYSLLHSMKNGSFDIIFSNHVLEHLSNLYSVFETFYKLLNKGGCLIIFVPNCSGIEKGEVFNAKKSYAFGEKHTMAFNDLFFKQNLTRYGFEVKCASTPYNTNNLFSKVVAKDKEYSELFVLAKKINKSKLTSV
ncbi:MAG: class I SAM-dependent methyltransferase [Candidatus Melainabacteria bacterium]|nr:class I SAM-dependent methyltransferase [Candidatus Melainabacteria bacterium]